MSIQELSATLPNGFHDAELRGIQMDYVARKLRLDLLVWIGSLNDDLRRELYRPALVTMHQVAYLVIEPPASRSSLLDGNGIRIDVGEGIPRDSTAQLPDSPAENSTSWVFLVELNTFLLFSAGQASLDWTGPEENRA